MQGCAQRHAAVLLGPLATVSFIVFGTLLCFLDSGYLCHFSTEMAEIWSPGTFFEDVLGHTKHNNMYIVQY